MKEKVGRKLDDFIGGCYMSDREWPRIVTARKEPDSIYLRFGRWSSKSMNFSTGEYEKGVSVYPATMEDGIVSIDWDLSASEWDALLGRCVWAVTGKDVGEGSDGEPLLRGVVARPYAINACFYRDYSGVV